MPVKQVNFRNIRDRANFEIRINRRPANRAVERPQGWPKIAEIEKAVDLPQKVFIGHMVVQAEVVKKPLRSCLNPHHRPVLPANRKNNGITTCRTDRPRLNQQNLPLPEVTMPVEELSTASTADMASLETSLLPCCTRNRAKE